MKCNGSIQISGTWRNIVQMYLNNKIDYMAPRHIFELIGNNYK